MSSDENNSTVRISLIILTQLLLFTSCFAQKEADAWLFGTGGVGMNRIRFDNNIGTLDTIQKPINFFRTNGLLCDKNGEVLVFTNGYSIFNGNNEIAINGEGLNPGVWRDNRSGPEDYEMPQGAIILPSLSDSLEQIIFHLRGDTLSYDSLTFYQNFAPVDLLVSKTRLNDQGVAEVIEINTSLISDTLTPGISACQHGNGRDWWIIVSESHSNCFYTILLSPEGLEIMPKQCLGAYHGFEEFTYTSFSPNGAKFLRGASVVGLEIFDFDRCSGLLEPPYLIPREEFIDSVNGYFWFGGHALSENSKILYANSGDKLYQFDMDASDLTASKILIHERDTPPTYGFQSMILAPDGKIYIAGGIENFHRINNPNQLGLACDFEKEIPTSFRTAWALPNVPNFRMGRLIGSECDTLYSSIRDLNDMEALPVYPNPSKDFVTIELGNLNSITNNALSIQMVNVLGQIVWSKELDTHVNETLIDVHRFTKGIYMVQLKEGSQLIAKTKIVIE